MTPAIAPTIRTRRTTTTGTTVPTTPPPVGDDPSSFWLPPLVSTKSRKIVEVKPFPDQYSLADMSPWWPDGWKRLNSTTHSTDHNPRDNSTDFRPAYPLSTRWKLDPGYYMLANKRLLCPRRLDHNKHCRSRSIFSFQNLMKCSQLNHYKKRNSSGISWTLMRLVMRLPQLKLTLKRKRLLRNHTFKS